MNPDWFYGVYGASCYLQLQCWSSLVGLKGILWSTPSDHLFIQSFLHLSVHPSIWKSTFFSAFWHRTLLLFLFVFGIHQITHSPDFVFGIIISTTMNRNHFDYGCNNNVHENFCISLGTHNFVPHSDVDWLMSPPCYCCAGHNISWMWLTLNAEPYSDGLLVNLPLDITTVQIPIFHKSDSYLV